MELLSAATESILSGAIEVGIGIVGFTGVVVALAIGRNRTGMWAFGFKTLLFTAIATIMFSFLPFLVLQFGFSGQSLWMIGSSVYLLYLPIVLVMRFRQFSNRDKEPAEDLAPYYRFLFVLGAGTLAVGLLQICNLLIFQSSWPYLVMVIYYVSYSLAAFAVNTLALLSMADDA